MSDLKIGVLETGRPPAELVEEFVSYPKMMADWLAPLGGSVASWAALDGELPSGPTEADLWVITGSKFGVYEDHAWIRALEQFVRDCRDADRPMVGICFGHQVIAKALGGTVVKSDKGWGVGVHEYAPTDWSDEALSGAPDALQMAVFHQDQVTTPPEGAKVVASSEFCENAALWYPGFAVTVQGHPEFGAAYEKALMLRKTDNPLAESDVKNGMSTVDNPTNSPDLVKIIEYALLKSRQSKAGAQE